MLNELLCEEYGISNQVLKKIVYLYPAILSKERHKLLNYLVCLRNTEFLNKMLWTILLSVLNYFQLILIHNYKIY